VCDVCGGDGEKVLDDTRAEIVCQMSKVRRLLPLRCMDGIVYISLALPIGSQLRLAAPGDATAAVGRGVHGLTSGAERALTTRQSTTDLWDSWNLLILHLDKSAGGTSTTLLLWLLVGSGVESEEEEEVAGQDDHAGKSSKLLTGANTRVWHPWEVAVGEVGV